MDFSSLLSGGGAGKTTSSVAETNLSGSGGSVNVGSQVSALVIVVGAVIVLILAVLIVRKL
jgi:preprotein translocase subunit SecG